MTFCVCCLSEFTFLNQSCNRDLYNDSELQLLKTNSIFVSTILLQYYQLVWHIFLDINIKLEPTSFFFKQLSNFQHSVDTTPT